MLDHSHLDKKYFISNDIYNCAFCNRRNVKYSLYDSFSFNWDTKKICYGYLIKCSSCGGKSMHLAYTKLTYENGYLREDLDFDSLIFYSVPTSFFVIDERIPKVIRELITEAEGSLKMNFLTGSSACMRKAIYELTIHEKSEGANYEDRIKSLKSKYANTDPELFDILAHIKDMTSDKVHEQSWDNWDSKYLKLIIETLKAVLHEIYVIPSVKKERSSAVMKLKEQVFGKKEEKKV